MGKQDRHAPSVTQNQVETFNKTRHAAAACLQHSQEGGKTKGPSRTRLDGKHMCILPPLLYIRGGQSVVAARGSPIVLSHQSSHLPPSCLL